MMGRIDTRREDAVARYASVFPEEIRDAIKAIDNKNRQAILGVLLLKGELSFAELRDLLGLKNNVMWPHLKALEKGGLIENFMRKGFTDRKRSFYRISPFGHRFVKALFESLSFRDVLIAPLAPTTSQPLQLDPDKYAVRGEEGIVVAWATSQQEYTSSIMLHQATNERS